MKAKFTTKKARLIARARILVAIERREFEEEFLSDDRSRDYDDNHWNNGCYYTDWN